MGKPNSLPTFSANLLTWKAARWPPRSPSTKVRAAPPTQGASLFELQFAPPPCATEAPFHSQHRPCTTLSKCPRACLLYCHFGLRTLLVLPHGLWALFAITIASRKVLRGPKGGASATKITRTNTKVVLHGYHTRHLFRLAFVSTKRTVDNRTRRPSSSSLCLLSLAKYHTISSFGNVWQTGQRCAIVKAQAPCTLLLRLPSRQYRSKAPYSCVGPAAPLELPRTSR